MTLRLPRLLVLVIAVLGLGATAAVAANPFTDVPTGHFATESIDWAYNNGVTQGTSATTFSPERPVTRAESVTFAFRYDRNVVQPALDELAAALSAQAARIDDLEPGDTALVEPGVGAVVMSHGGPTGNDFGTRVRHGESRLSLAGPMSIGGAEYELASVRYCIADVVGDRPVRSVAVYGVDADGPQQLALDDTERSEDGCHELVVGSTMGSFVMAIDVGWGCSLDLWGVTSTWVPVV